MTQEEWAEKIRSMILDAEKDGFSVGIDDPCCGCPNMNLAIWDDDDNIVPIVWDDDNTVPIVWDDDNPFGEDE